MSLLEQKPELGDLLEECLIDTRRFASAFMPTRFWRPWRDLHDEFFEYLDDETAPYIAIAAPRGFGKTTIDSIAYPAKKVVYQETKFIELVSCTATVAAQNVKNLGRELTGNKMIRKIFGPMKGPIWSEGRGDLETRTGIKILARGAGQQIRGLLEGESRPDLVVIDDLEDSEPFRLGDPSEYLRKIKEWFWSDLMNSLDKRGGTRVIYVGTILHEDSLLQNLLDDPDWKSVRLELFDDNYKSNYPELMSDAEVRKLVHAFRRRGMLDTLFREYRNVAIAAEDAIFKDDMFRYWNREEDPVNDMSVDRVVIVDPAKTVKIHSAFTAVTGWGFSARKNRIYQLDTVNKKLHPHQIYEEALNMAKRLRTTTIAAEVTGLEEFLTWPFNTYLSRHGYPNIVELKARGGGTPRNKPERIKQLAPLYSMGAIYHHPDEEIHGPLEAQLRPFPRSKFLDVADCSAYFIELFALGDRFFGMPDDEDARALEEEIAALDALEADIGQMSGDWRCAP